MATIRSSTARVRTITSWIRRSSAGSRSATAGRSESADRVGSLRLVRVVMTSGPEQEGADVAIEVVVPLDHRPVAAVGVNLEVGVLQDALKVVGVGHGDHRV